jgi:hypothetical protein
VRSASSEPPDLALFPDQDKDPGYEGEDREENADAHAGEADDADDDQVNREQEHADVFVEVHDGIVPNGTAQCTRNLRSWRTRLPAALWWNVTNCPERESWATRFGEVVNGRPSSFTIARKSGTARAPN